MNKFQFDRKKLPSSHKIRISQAFMQYAAGAMVDFPERTLLTAAPYTWHYGEDDNEEGKPHIIEDKRFAKALKVDGFLVPSHVSYVQFPEWYFCPLCRRFQPISDWQREAEALDNNPYRARHRHRLRQTAQISKAFVPHCSRRECHGQTLIPARVVVACPHGHLDDFPWIKWVHYRNISGSKPCCDHPQLRFESGGSGTEIGEDIRVVCTNCNAVATLKGAFAADAFSQISKDMDSPIFTCTGRLPDFGIISSGCNETPRALLRGASALYFPMVRSSLVISFQPDCAEADIDDLAYRWEEYKALCSDNSTEENPKLSRVQAGAIAEYERLGKLQLVQVALIDKLSIIRAFLGYSRIRPAVRRDDEGFVHSRLPQDKTYPAYEAYGEGIFLRFSDEAFKIWEQFTPQVTKRAALVEQNRQNSIFSDDRHEVITAKFLLLHTLAHLLIRELSYVSGYNVTEIGERIYCADREANNCDFDMSGLLLYVAGGDSEGTLGGLIRQGRADTLPQIFQRALKRAKYCSNDPLCSGSYGQGKDGENLAACHSCALIPETSCEEFNAFLDRGVVVGTLQEPNIGFFGGSWASARQS